MKKAQKKKSRKSDRMLDGEKFQNWLISFRKQNKLRLRQISELTGISTGRLSTIENGQVKNPSLRYFTAFARALGHERLSDFITELER
jgi:transcriptional regulator with XRE-family HTH domain